VPPAVDNELTAAEGDLVELGDYVAQRVGGIREQHSDTHHRRKFLAQNDVRLPTSSSRERVLHLHNEWQAAMATQMHGTTSIVGVAVVPMMPCFLSAATLYGCSHRLFFSALGFFFRAFLVAQLSKTAGVTFYVVVLGLRAVGSRDRPRAGWSSRKTDPISCQASVTINVCPLILPVRAHRLTFQLQRHCPCKFMSIVPRVCDA